MKAIETIYNDYKFRSRVEARWAVFFNTLGLPWEYEPEGFDLGKVGWYLPDFLVTYPGRSSDERHKIWFEVKGDLATISEEEVRKVVALEEANSHSVILLDGTPAETAYCDMELVKNHTYFSVYPDSYYMAEPYVMSEHIPEVLGYIRNFGNQKHDKRFGSILWSSKGRIWIDEASNIFGDDNEWQPLLSKAIRSARQARFEHGECG